MPIYRYQCDECGNLNELLVSSQDTEICCEKCKSEKMTKLISKPFVARKTAMKCPSNCSGEGNGCNSKEKCCQS